jgi:thiamine-monophosphate kinase
LKDEFKLIQKLLATASRMVKRESDFIKVPAGDDACLLSGLKYPVVTTDTHRENIHFRFDWQTPEEIGWKAVSVTLSDLAASYAAPVSLFINLGIPSSASEKIAEELYTGIGRGLAEYDCALGGGNISGSDFFSLDLFAIGEGAAGLFPLRSAAKPGDGLYCTGPLGKARAGLELLKRKDNEFQKLVNCFKSPKARFDAAKVLMNHGICCVIDISDGLKGDAMHLAEASCLTIALSIDGKDIDSDLAAFCKKYGLKPEDMAIAGGEDYELLFSCTQDVYGNLKNDLPDVYPVGRCLPFTGKHILAPFSELSSFQHGIKQTSL